MVATASACLTEDELLALAGGALADAPAAEAHLAACATCSALLAAAIRRAPRPAWGALAGTTLGPYRIDAQIGAGGMGAVYRAWDPRLGRAIAVKVLHGGGDGGAEARAAAAIDHRAIVGIYDVGVADGVWYVAMELVDGESLRSALAGGAGVGRPRAREVTIELADALAAAHAKGVVHGDLKPENLVLARGGLRVLDFGLAKLIGASGVAGDAVAAGADDDSARAGRTGDGVVQGTAGYMAPEQARGEPADARADLFAAGAIAYELVTGRRAFPGATAAERLSATLRDTPAMDALGELAPIVGRCLAKSPDDRFQTAADLAWALRSLNDAPAALATSTAPPPPAAPAPAAPTAPPPSRISRRALLVGGATTFAAAAGGYLFGRRGSRTAAASTAPTVRPLTHRTGRVSTARFTRDGARVVYGAAWGTDALRVHQADLASGDTVLLDIPPADVLAVSPHNELAVSFGRAFVDHQSARGDLAAVALPPGAPRPLAADVQDADFGPDGDALAVIAPTARGFRIEYPIGTVLVDEPGWLTHVRVAPDGARVAYLRHPHTDDDSGALVVFDVATRLSRELCAGWTSIAGLAWAPAGDALWFTASRDDLINQLYRVSTSGDMSQQPGPSSGRLRLHDVASDGRALVTADAWRLRAMVGDRDESLSEVSYVSDISADGAFVVIGELGDVESGSGTQLVPWAGGRSLRLGSGFPVAISPSGRRVAANVNVDDHLVVYSTRDGASPPIATPGFVTAARWIDEAALVAVFDRKLWRIAGGAAPVALAETAGSFALDPARRRCAYLDRSRVLRILDLATGASHVVPDLPPLVRDDLCGWLAAPDAVAVRSTTTPIAVARIDAATGARAPLFDVRPPPVGLKAVDTFVLHADGARYAYSYGQELSQLVLLTTRT